MLDIIQTIFKYREKKSPDQLGYYPERVHVNAMPERRYLWTSRLLVIISCLSISVSMMLASAIYLLLPQRGVKKDLLKLANENAVKLLNERLRKGSLSLKNDLQAAEELQQALGLEHPLERMDCFDISHTQGSETVASMVVFRNGTSSKKDYRRYKIVSAEGKPDDFKSMQEVVYRRYRDYEDLPSPVSYTHLTLPTT